VVWRALERLVHCRRRLELARDAEDGQNWWTDVYALARVPVYRRSYDLVGWVPYLTTETVPQQVWREPTFEELCQEAFAGDADGHADFCLGRSSAWLEDEPLAVTAEYPNRLNEEEKAVCRRIGWRSCLEYADDARAAIAFTEAMWSGRWAAADGTRANTFQHAAWVSFMVASDFAHRREALDFATAHEPPVCFREAGTTPEFPNGHDQQSPGAQDRVGLQDR
jgi:hypothetical protein